MSRKHFVKLAAAIAGIESYDDRARTAELIGAVCADCNAHFDWRIWRSACNVDQPR